MVELHLLTASFYKVFEENIYLQSGLSKVQIFERVSNFSNEHFLSMSLLLKTFILNFSRTR